MFEVQTKPEKAQKLKAWQKTLYGKFLHFLNTISHGVFYQRVLHMGGGQNVLCLTLTPNVIGTSNLA